MTATVEQNTAPAEQKPQAAEQKAVVERVVVRERMPRRFTAKEYERMGEVGILDEDERVELIDGEIVEMAAVNSKHVKCVARLSKLLGRLVPDAYIVHVQNPVHLSRYKQPQPDLYIVRDRKYEDIPTPADVLLLIEVSDSSLAYDRNAKMHMYAEAGIAEYWVADVTGQIVERFAEPQDGTYGRRDEAHAGDTLTALAVPEIAVTVADIWE